MLMAMHACLRCGWLLASCFVLAALHHKASSADAAPHTSTSTSTTTDDSQQQHNKLRQRTTKYPRPEMESAGGVTCYTCVNVSDNSICNRYAIDHPCPRGESFCHTLHIMDSRGASVVVNKKCANPAECSSERVGCLQIDTQKVCVSCCDAMYCNVSVPTNQSGTVFYTNTRKHHDHQQQPSPSNNTANSQAVRQSLVWSTYAIVVFTFMAQ